MTSVKFPKKSLALGHGALTGWAGVLIIDILTLPFIEGGSESYIGSLINALGIVPIYILMGLPIAFILCFLIGWPLWMIIEIRKALSIQGAIFFGMVMGAILGGAFNIIFYFNDLFPIYWLVIDFLSTVAVGGFAGWKGFKFASKEAKT